MDQKELKDIVLIEEFLKRFNESVDKFCDSVNKINERIGKMEDFENICCFSNWLDDC